MPDQAASPILRLRACDVYEPRGRLSKSTFYRYVRGGHIAVRKIGRTTFIEGVATADELMDKLSRSVPAGNFGVVRRQPVSPEA